MFQSPKREVGVSCGIVVRTEGTRGRRYWSVCLLNLVNTWHKLLTRTNYSVTSRSPSKTRIYNLFTLLSECEQQVAVLGVAAVRTCIGNLFYLLLAGGCMHNMISLNWIEFQQHRFSGRSHRCRRRLIGFHRKMHLYEKGKGVWLHNAWNNGNILKRWIFNQ